MKRAWAIIDQRDNIMSHLEGSTLGFTRDEVLADWRAWSRVCGWSDKTHFIGEVRLEVISAEPIPKR